MDFKVVCLDLGGVMVRIRHTWEEIFRDLEIMPPHDAALGALADSVALHRFQTSEIEEEDFWKDLQDELGDLPLDTVKNVFNHILRDEYPGALELVNELKEKGYKVGCLSNTNRPHIDECMNSGRFPVCHAFDRLVTSYELELSKPQPEIYCAFEEIFDVSPKDIIFFDDSLANVRGAIDCGWTAHQIDPHEDPPRQIREILFP